MRRNLVSLLALLVLCGFAARWTQPPAQEVRLSLQYGDRSPLARLPDATLTIAGVSLDMPKDTLLEKMGRPASYEKTSRGALLTFSRVTTLLSDDRVVWVSGTELQQGGQRVRAGGDPREVMHGIPGFEVIELASDEMRGGLTTLYWAESKLRSDTVFATDAWSSEYALGREPVIRERPPGGKRLFPF